MKEAYTVNLDYQKDDGYWVCGHKETILVEIKGKEKDNHSEAEMIARLIYPKCKINYTSYQ